MIMTALPRRAADYALLAALGTSDRSDILACGALAQNGTYTVAFIDTSTGAAGTVTVKAPLFGTLKTWSCSAANQNTANSNIVTRRDASLGGRGRHHAPGRVDDDPPDAITR